MFGALRWRQVSGKRMALGARAPVSPWASLIVSSSSTSSSSANRSRCSPSCSRSFSAVPYAKPLPTEEEEIALFRHYREKHYNTISIQVPVVRRRITVHEPSFKLSTAPPVERISRPRQAPEEQSEVTPPALPAFGQNFARRQFPQFQPRSETLHEETVQEDTVQELVDLHSEANRAKPARKKAQAVLEPQLEVSEDVVEDLEPSVSRTSLKAKPRSKTLAQKVQKQPIITESKRKPLGEQEVDHSNARIVIVDDDENARRVVDLLQGKYRNEVHACDTEVAGIDVKKDSPVGHGRVICFSIYCGPEADFGDGNARVWVDVLRGGEKVLDIFKAYFEDPTIKKIWHNYSFDKHILGNHGINARGLYADTMHLARLWDSARSGAQGGYTLEALSSDAKIMSDVSKNSFETGKTSMKDLFAKTNIKKDGTEGKLKVIPPVEELQSSEETRPKWIYYSTHDAVCTWHLWSSLKKKLEKTSWYVENEKKGNMYEFYNQYWREFAELLIEMEAEGMLVDREHLAEVEKVALSQKQLSYSRFQKWASTYCPDAIHMNVCSDAQIRQLLFGGCANKKDSNAFYPKERAFKIPNTEGIIEPGAKSPKKYRDIVLRGVDVTIPVDVYTPIGWPAVNGAVLRSLAGNVAVDYGEEDEEDEVYSEQSTFLTSGGVEGGEEDLSVYGKAYEAFGGGEEGKRACMAFAALCELSSIDTLISNFIQPLQNGQIVGADGRVHCSLNINTETGRLSARRPNLQNQPALEKDRYKIRQAFVAPPGKSLIVADYGQLELRILAHLTGCQSMLEAFEAGGDFHSRTALNMYPHVRKAVEEGKVLLEWDPKPGETKPPVPMLKDLFGSERRKAKMLNFSIAYGKTAMGLSKDWKVSYHEAQETLELWYNDRQEVKEWQLETIERARITKRVHTLLGRSRHLPEINSSNGGLRGHYERAAINTPVQGSAADVAMCAMLEINRNKRLKELGWKLILQVHDEVILEGPTETCEEAQKLVVQCMSFPFNGENFLKVKLDVDADHAESWYQAK